MTRKICNISILTALYIVLSAFMKIPLIGNIQLDLGYLAFAVAICLYGPWGAVVGVVGCALESILFSAYGFSISWAAANAVIGLGCGFTFLRIKNIWLRCGLVFIFGVIGLLCVKTGIECRLYHIPLVVKLPKNAVATIADVAVMFGGLFLHKLIANRMEVSK